MRLMQYDRFQMCIQVQGKLEVLSSKYSSISILFGEVEVQQPTSNFSTIGTYSHEYSGLVKRTILTCSKKACKTNLDTYIFATCHLGIIFYLTYKGEEYGNVVLSCYVLDFYRPWEVPSSMWLWAKEGLGINNANARSKFV